jgi:UDP-N-acetylmuramate dehydrogenase
LPKNDFSQPDFFTALLSSIKQGRVLTQELLSRHTTFQIGGPADWMVLPASIEEVAAVVRVAATYAAPLLVIGNGSNLLVRDKGVRGLVLKVGEAMADMRCEGETVIAGAGALLADVSKFAAANGLSGLEFAVGIPGSIGGAVFMNAGAYDGEMRMVVQAVTAVCPAGTTDIFAAEQLRFGYRHSVFQENHCILCEVQLHLHRGISAEIEAKMKDLTARRESKQPLEWPSAGSTFQRPAGFFAGTLVEEAGCKGLCCGDAQVSEKHAGFIINAGQASAAEVQQLIRLVQQRVREKSGVELRPEVIILGEE